MISGTFENNSFDLLTFRDNNTFEIPDDDGNVRKLNCNERYYASSEITWLLKMLGMKKIEIWGYETGNYARKLISVNDFEMLVISSK